MYSLYGGAVMRVLRIVPAFVVFHNWQPDPIAWSGRRVVLWLWFLHVVDGMHLCGLLGRRMEYVLRLLRSQDQDDLKVSDPSMGSVFPTQNWSRSQRSCGALVK